jgi:hypothetical protein
MRVLQFLHGRRMVLCLSLLGLLALAGGCGDQNPVTAVSPEAGKEHGEAQRKAREAAYGKAGVPVGKPKPAAQ